MESELLKAIVSSGPLGLVLAYALWQNNKMVKTIIEIVKNNTKAMTELKEKMK